jgi:3'(2'), 5'-bisphosphate nucleotidase
MNRKELLELSIQASLKASEKIMEIYSREFSVEEKEDKSPLTEADTAAHLVIKEFLEETPYPILSEEGKSIDFSERSSWETYWCVDPIDGTKEFIKRNGEFTVNIALIHNQVPVMGVIYAPVLETLYFAEEEIGAYKVQLEDFNDVDFLIESSEKLPCSKTDIYTIVGSRSHMSDETKEFVEDLKIEHGHVEIVSKGSSLKLCMVAEGVADIYPRYAPTMEWDTAAGQAIATCSGATVINYDTNEPLVYNKEVLRNPWFTVSRI